jgi:hypothetical protein
LNQGFEEFQAYTFDDERRMKQPSRICVFTLSFDDVSVGCLEQETVWPVGIVGNVAYATWRTRFGDQSRI